MRTLIIRVLISTILCVSQSKERDRVCRGGELVRTTFGEGFDKDQKWAITYGLRGEVFPSEETPVYYFKKTTKTNGQAKQWVLKLETEPIFYGRLVRTTHSWVFHDIDEEKYDTYFRWCHVKTPRPPTR